jgi:hypothetical protein
MPMIDNADSLREKVQKKVPEPVLATGMVMPPGTFSGGLGGIGIPLIGMFARSKGNKRANGLAKQGVFFGSNRTTVLALTADKVYAFTAKSGWGGMKIKDPVLTWERKNLKIATEPRQMTTLLTIDDAASKEHYEVEVGTGLGQGKISEPFLAEISKPGS